MAYKIRWTPEAEKTFDAIILYLDEKWTEREIVNFVIKTNDLINLIATYPRMFKYSSKTEIRVGFVTNHISLFYKIEQNDQFIILLSFWDNRQDPTKRKY